MHNKSKLLWLIPLVILLLLIPFIIPSGALDAYAEGSDSDTDIEEIVMEEPAGESLMTDDGHPIGWTKEDLPEYVPVDLANPNPDPLPVGESKKNVAIPAPYAPHSGAFLPDHAGYTDSTISVRIETRTIMNTKVFFTFVQIADPSQLRTETFGGEASVKDRAGRVKSVLAINGDWCNAKEKQGRGVIYRNGVLKRNVDYGYYDGLFIDTAGDFHILRHAKKETVASSDFADNIVNSFVFGPALVIDGELVHLNTSPGYSKQKGTEVDDTLVRQIGSFKQTQRTTLCQMGPLSYLIITAEGPEQSEGGGFSTDQMARMAWDMGALQAFNLDGGSSAALVLGTDRLNALGNGGKSNRAIGDMIYFVTAEP